MCSVLSWGNLGAHSSISQCPDSWLPASASGLDACRAVTHGRWALGLAVPWWVGSQLPHLFCVDLGDQGEHDHLGSLKVLLHLSLMAPLLQAPISSHVPAPTLPVGAGTGPQVPAIQPACKPSRWAVHCALFAGPLVAELTALLSQASGDPTLISSCVFSVGLSPPSHKVTRSCWTQVVPNPIGLCPHRRGTWTQRHTQGEAMHSGALLVKGISSFQSSSGEGLAIPLQPGITSPVTIDLDSQTPGL